MKNNTEEQLEKLRELLKNKELNKRYFTHFDNYLNQIKDNLTEQDIQNLFSKNYIRVTIYQKNKQELDEIKENLIQALRIQNEQTELENEQLKQQLLIDKINSKIKVFLDEEDKETNQEILDLAIDFVKNQNQQSLSQLQDYLLPFDFEVVQEILKKLSDKYLEKGQITSIDIEEEENFDTNFEQENLNFQNCIQNQIQSKINQIYQSIYTEEHFDDEEIVMEVIYDLFTDSSSEYHIQKLKFIQENFTKITNCNQKDVVVVGFYGYKEEIKKQIQKFFQSKIRFNENVYTKKNQQTKEESQSQYLKIFKGQKQNKIAQALIVDDKIFQESYDSNNNIVDFISILKDTCIYIKICLPENIILDRDTKTPFNQAPISGFTFQVLQDEQFKDLKFKKLDCQTSQFSLGKHTNAKLSKFFVRAKIGYKKIIEPFQISVQNFSEMECDWKPYHTNQHKLINFEESKIYLYQNIYKVLNTKDNQQKCEYIVQTIGQFVDNEFEQHYFDSVQPLLDHIKQNLENKYLEQQNNEENDQNKGSEIQDKEEDSKIQDKEEDSEILDEEDQSLSQEKSKNSKKKKILGKKFCKYVNKRQINSKRKKQTDTILNTRIKITQSAFCIKFMNLQAQIIITFSRKQNIFLKQVFIFKN